jgi:hypothetical protein
MDDLRLVFSDVLARPEEDAPREAFADAVEATDPDWAQYIRLELQNLEWLDLTHNHIGEDGLEALAASPSLPRLGYLRFERNAALDPTPRFVDAYSSISRAASALQAKYGHREWLEPRSAYHWPPSREVVG